MLSRKLRNKRRACKTRLRIRSQNKVRLCIYRSLKNLYAQIIETQQLGDKVLASASTLDAEVKAAGGACNVKGAAIIGAFIAKRALAKGIRQVAYDRSGYKYHAAGQVGALAGAARKEGLEF